jgi:hypothetical protein
MPAQRNGDIHMRLARTGRLRQMRVIRDYGLFDRREAPQYYPEVNNRRIA